MNADPPSEPQREDEDEDIDDLWERRPYAARWSPIEEEEDG